MGAKAIIERYVERKRSALPNDPKELRKKLSSVASEAKLELTKKELDELVSSAADKGANKGQNKPEKESAVSDTSGEDLKEIESN